MKRIPNRSSAFTLIELLISTAMVSIIAVSMYGFVVTLHDADQYLTDRSDALEKGQRAIRTWRTDVEFSFRNAIEPDGQSMTVWRSGPAGNEYSIQYSLTEANELFRVDESKGREERLCVGLAELQFAQIGRAISVDLEFQSSDGVRNRKWDMAAFATPLSADGGTPQ